MSKRMDVRDTADVKDMESIQLLDFFQIRCHDDLLRMRISNE